MMKVFECAVKSRFNTSFLVKGLILVGLATMPFVYWPAAKIPYEIPRVMFFLGWAEVLTVLGVLASLGDRRKLAINLRVLFLESVLLGVVVVSSAWGVDFGKSWWGNYWRFDGILTLIHLISFSAIVAVFLDGDLKAKIPGAIIWSAFVLSVWTIGVGVFEMAMHREFIAVGISFGQPKFLGGYLLVSLPFLAFFSASWKSRSVWLVEITILSAIVFSGSTSSLMLAITYIWFWQLRRGKPWVVFILSVAALGLIANLGIRKLADFRFTGDQELFVFESRERIFKKLSAAFIQKPVLGWGWANVDYAFKSVDWPVKVERDAYVDKAHSSLMEVFVTTGFLGGLLFVLIVLATARKLRGSLWLAPLVIFLVHSQTNVISISEEILFWLMVGVAMGNPK